MVCSFIVYIIVNILIITEKGDKMEVIKSKGVIV